MRSTVGNYRGDNIVTRGLVLYLDAGSPNSYYGPSNSPVWKDLSGNGNNGTLVNGVGYSDGAMVFDGVNDRISLNDITISSSSDWTIQTWVQSNQTLAGSSYLRLLNRGTGGGSNYFIFEWNNRILARNSTGGTFAFQSGWTPGLPLDNSIFLLTLTGKSGLLEVYSNLTKTTVSIILSGDLIFNSLMNGINTYLPGGNMCMFSLYNRALIPSEISQNFNAQRSRFGI